MSKICLLITSLGQGGAEKVASELKNNFSECIDTKLVVLTDNIVHSQIEKPTSLNLKLDRNNPIQMIYSILVGAHRYRTFLREFDPDISLSFLVVDNVINLLANLGFKERKVIFSVRSVLSRKVKGKFKSKLYKIAIRWIYSKASLIIAVSNGVKEELITDFGICEQKIIVIPNPVDKEKIEKLSKEPITELNLQKGIPLLINVGRLERAKGQWHLLRAFHSVRQVVPAKLILCGEGNLREFLESLCRELHLESDVIFLGWQDNPYKFMSHSTIFILSSIWDAQPNVLLEAMACGLPIISTDCPFGPREILHDGQCGKLVYPLDDKYYGASEPLTKEELNLATEIVNLLLDKELQLHYRRQGYERINQYNIRVIVRMYEEILLNKIK